MYVYHLYLSFIIFLTAQKEGLVQNRLRACGRGSVKCVRAELELKSMYVHCRYMSPILVI